MSLLCVVASAAGCASQGWVPGGSQAPPQVAGDAQTEEAIALLRRMSEFLASRPALGFEAEIRYDAVQQSGQKIEFGSLRRVALQRPDRVRVEVSHWDGEQELIIFDRERLSAALPEQQIYSSIQFTGSVADAFDQLSTEYGMATPLADLLRRDLADYVAERARSGRRLEAVTIAGVRCDHLAFRGERVDFQLFIRQGVAPVPIRFVIDYHAEPGGPQFRAQLRDWNLEPSLAGSTFRFVPSAGAQRVPHAELLDLLLGPLEPAEDDQ